MPHKYGKSDAVAQVGFSHLIFAPIFKTTSAAKDIGISLVDGFLLRTLYFPFPMYNMACAYAGVFRATMA
jgi:hypothetical protein